MGCELYQPSSWKGKLVVSLLPYLSLFGILPFKVSNIGDSIPTEVLHQIEQQFGVGCVASAFLGTPGTHKKTTIQISKDNAILGYAKYSASMEIQKLFSHEKDFLEWLQKKKIEHVPACIGLSRVNGSLMLFMQSTEKQVGARAEHTFSPKLESFLDELYSRTKVGLPYEASDFYRTMCFLQSNADLLPTLQRNFVEETISMVNGHYAQKTVEFGACHRDFTPWNTCVLRDGALFVFDWEYARKTYPFGLDKCHFLVQTMKFEKHCSIQKIGETIRQNNWFGLDQLTFMAYCLDNAAIYMERGTEDDFPKVKEQIDLLECIQA